MLQRTLRASIVLSILLASTASGLLEVSRSKCVGKGQELIGQRLRLTAPNTVSALIWYNS